MPLTDPKSEKREHAEGQERGKQRKQNRMKLGLSVKVVKAKSQKC